MPRIAAALVWFASSSLCAAHAQCIALEGLLNPIGGAAGDEFGGALELSGDYAYCGAPGQPVSQGRVRVLRRSVFDWTEVDVISPPNFDPNGRFGASIARDGSWLAIGQPAKDGAGFDEGRVEVFGGTDGAWSHHSTLSSSTISAGDNLGGAISLSADTLVAGARFDSFGGVAFVYEFNGVSWSEVDRLEPADLGVNDAFGASCAVRGSWMAIGAPSQAAGAVYMFERSGGAWMQQAKLSASDAVNLDRFGVSVALRGATLAVGAPNHFSLGFSSAGKAYVFVRQSSFWFEQAGLDPEPKQAGLFGTSLALHQDVVCVGAPGKNYARLFTRTGTLWSAMGPVPAPTGSNGQYGARVAVDSERALISRPTSGAGTVFSWRLNGGVETYCTAKLNSQGCTPAIDVVGSPSVTATAPCWITASNVLDNRAGLLFYSTTAAASAQFLGGTLCVQAPLRRTSIQFAGGVGGCDGMYSFDLNGYVAAQADPALVPGAKLWGQYWSRDPGFSPPNNVGLSDAVALILCP